MVTMKHEKFLLRAKEALLSNNVVAIGEKIS